MSCKGIQHKKYLPVEENSKEGVADGRAKQMDGRVNKVDGSILIED